MKVAVVSGAIANKCRNGGEAWVRLSWIRALQKLGFETYFFEQLAREHCIGPEGSPADFFDSENIAYFRQVTEDFGLADSAGLIFEGGQESYGLNVDQLLELGASADVLINISGHMSPALLKPLRCQKVFVDIDPGFTQFWHAEGSAGARVKEHDFYFTIGENIGTPQCSIPTGGVRWRATRQPVVLDDWPVMSSTGMQRFTTIASWRGTFGSVQYQGRTYGSKVHEFRKIVELPDRTAQAFEIALNIHPADQRDVDLLRHWGWQLADPAVAAADPQRFREYIQGSGAEFSVAQGAYVETNSGWFSDRTVRYLASGKPALVQETGLRDRIPVGQGLLTFRDLDEAVRGAERIAADYEGHCAAARSLAAEYFDSDRVLGRMLEEIGVSP